MYRCIDMPWYQHPQCMCAPQNKTRIVRTRCGHTQQAAESNFWIGCAFKRQTNRWISLSIKKIKSNQKQNKTKIGNVLKVLPVSLLLFKCVHSASRVWLAVCRRRRLVYGAKIYTYPPTHTHRHAHIHCKCRKFLLLSFVALFVCIAPRVWLCE